MASIDSRPCNSICNPLGHSHTSWGTARLLSSAIDALLMHYFALTNHSVKVEAKNRAHSTRNTRNPVSSQSSFDSLTAALEQRG